MTAALVYGLPINHGNFRAERWRSADLRIQDEGRIRRGSGEIAHGFDVLRGRRHFHESTQRAQARLICFCRFACRRFAGNLCTNHVQASPEQIQALQKKLDTLAEPNGGSAGRATTALRWSRHRGTRGPEERDLPLLLLPSRSKSPSVEVELTPKQNRTGSDHRDLPGILSGSTGRGAHQQRAARPGVPGILPHPGYEYAHAHRRIRQDRLHLRHKASGKSRRLHPRDHPDPITCELHQLDHVGKGTRFNLDFRRTVEIGRRTATDSIFEMDFFGTNATTPRLRHAYGQAKNFLLGQTFSNFMDPDAGPDQIDEQGPNAQVVSIRSPLFQYSVLVAKKTTFSLSAEKPTSDVLFTTPEFDAQPNSPSPDGTLKIRREMDRGHLQLSALFRSVAAFLPDGRHESVFGWGFNFAGATRLWGKDTAVYQVAYGNGIERYINDTSGLGIDAAVSSLQNPHIQALPVVATYGALQHFWNDARTFQRDLQLRAGTKHGSSARFDISSGPIHGWQPDLESVWFTYRGRRIPLRLASE